MNTIPVPKLILGYKEFFEVTAPSDRIGLLQGICKTNLVAEFAGLNYQLKSKISVEYDTSLDFQVEKLRYFCPIDKDLYRRYVHIASSYAESREKYPLIFTRQTCLFALEEIIQSDLPVIENFDMKRVEVWDAIFKYILAVNEKITEIGKQKEDEPVDFETLNPKLLPLSELSLSIDPIYTPYRGYQLLAYISTIPQLKDLLSKYFDKVYSISYENFVYQLISLYFANEQAKSWTNFYYHVKESDTKLFDTLSQKFPSSSFEKLLSIKKYPFYKPRANEYILLDNTLLIDKAYNQFINDFWFDFLKYQVNESGKAVINISQYKSHIGYFFEKYINEIFTYSFSGAKFYIVKLFDQLKVNCKNGEIELADVYVRYGKKVFLGQVKVTSLYDRERYSGNVDEFYKNDRDKFFDSFGIKQLVVSIQDLEANIAQIDKYFPIGKRYRIYPAVIVNEKALQTPFMSQIFQNRFRELIGQIKISRIHIYPLTIIHVSDLESIQDYVRLDLTKFWNLLKYHYRFPKFIPPFYNSIARRNIRPNYNKTMSLLRYLVKKHQKQ